MVVSNSADVHVHEADSKDGTVSTSQKRMTMAYSPEGSWPPWEAERMEHRARKAKEKCTRCDEWKRKFREQNVSYFREIGHFQHGIKKLLSRCAEGMTEKHYRQLEQSLQLDVRFFSEHNVMDADFAGDSPRFQRGGDEEAMAELKEKNATLEEDNAALQQQVEELEASLRQAHDEAVAARRSQKINERPATAPDVVKVEVHCQTDQEDEDATFQVDHTDLVKRELDKMVMNRDNLAAALQSSQQEARAAALERKALEQRVRDLGEQLERKISAAIPGEKVPQMGGMRARMAMMSGAPSNKETSQSEVGMASFSEQVAESDARVQGTLVVPDPTPPDEGAAAGEADQASLEVEGGGTMADTTAAESGDASADAAPPKEAKLNGSFTDASTRLIQSFSAGVQCSVGTADFCMQVQEWDLEGGATMRLRANMASAAQEHAITRKAKAFGKAPRDGPKFSICGAPGGGRPLSGGTFGASTTASTQHRQSGERKRGSTAMTAKLPVLSDVSPLSDHVKPRRGPRENIGHAARAVLLAAGTKQAWLQGDGTQEDCRSASRASTASAGFLPNVPSAVSTAMSGSRSAAELGLAGERTSTPPRGVSRELVPPAGAVGLAAAQPLLGSAPPLGAEALPASDGPGKKKRSKVKEKEPEPYLYEVWEKHPDSHKKPSDAELVKLGAYKPPPPPEPEASSDQAAGAGAVPADA